MLVFVCCNERPLVATWPRRILFGAAAVRGGIKPPRGVWVHHTTLPSHGRGGHMYVCTHTHTTSIAHAFIHQTTMTEPRSPLQCRGQWTCDT